MYIVEVLYWLLVRTQAARQADVKDSRLLAAIGAMVNGQRTMLEMPHASLAQLLAFAFSARIHEAALFAFARRFCETRLPPPFVYSPPAAAAAQRTSESGVQQQRVPSAAAAASSSGRRGAAAFVPDINQFESSTEQPPRLKDLALGVRASAHFVEPLHPNLRAFALYFLRRTIAVIRDSCGEFGPLRLRRYTAPDVLVTCH